MLDMITMGVRAWEITYVLGYADSILASNFNREKKLVGFESRRKNYSIRMDLSA